MSKTAEWWVNEDGGVFCSHCGYFYDDYLTSEPAQCPQCSSIMTANNNRFIDRRYTLSNLCGRYLDSSEYPEWLLSLKRRYLADTLSLRKTSNIF